MCFGDFPCHVLFGCKGVFVCMTGMIWNVQMVGEEVTGPPTKMDWTARGDKEKFLKDPACHQTLWECSEVATGVAL